MELSDLANAVGNYFSRAAGYVTGIAERVNFSQRNGVAAAALLGMLTLPSAAGAEPKKLISEVNGEVNGHSCLEAETIVLYDRLDECKSYTNLFVNGNGKRSILNVVTDNLVMKGYKVRYGGQIPDNFYSRQDSNHRLVEPKLAIIPFYGDEISKECMSFLFSFSNSQRKGVLAGAVIYLSDFAGSLSDFTRFDPSRPETQFYDQVNEAIPYSCQRLRDKKVKAKYPYHFDFGRDRLKKGVNDTPCLRLRRFFGIGAIDTAEGNYTPCVGFGRVWEMGKIDTGGSSLPYDPCAGLSVDDAKRTLLNCAP